MSTEIAVLELRGSAGPIAYYAEPPLFRLHVRVIRCGDEFAVTVFRLENQLAAFDYLPREPVPDGPLDTATVTRLVREALGEGT